jgi:hypothetical protein
MPIRIGVQSPEFEPMLRVAICVSDVAVTSLVIEARNVVDPDPRHRHYGVTMCALSYISACALWAAPR